MMIEIGVTGLVIALLAFWVLWPREGFKPPQTQPISQSALSCFEAAPSLFVNKSETALFSALSIHMPSDCHVMAKVRLEDILRVKTSIKDSKLRWHMRGRVKSRHVDFLIINSRGKLLLAVELDGNVHNQREVRQADYVKDALFSACNVPLIRISTGQVFSNVAQQIALQVNRLNLAS